MRSPWPLITWTVVVSVVWARGYSAGVDGTGWGCGVEGGALTERLTQLDSNGEPEPYDEVSQGELNGLFATWAGS